MNTRRQFLIKASILAGATLLPEEIIAGTAYASTTQQHVNLESLHLDLPTAKSIVTLQSGLIRRHTDGKTWLNLGRYSDYKQNALDYLVGNIDQIEGIEIGFHELTPDGAIALSRLRNLSFIYLNGLTRLEADTASKLWWSDINHRPLRDIVVQEPISEETALALADGPKGYVKECDYSDGSLSLSVPSISPAVAEALRHHNQELFLRIREKPLEPEAASSLAYHSGYMLALNLNRAPSSTVMAGLSCNSVKKVNYSSNRQAISLIDTSFGSTGIEELAIGAY